MKNRRKEEPARYRIRLEGCLDKHWQDWFGQMCISHGEGHTILDGSIRDQSALHGILARIRDLNLTLVSLERLTGKGR